MSGIFYSVATKVPAPFNDILLNKKCEILLTPHPGEMSRLCGLSVADIEENREEIIVDF